MERRKFCRSFTLGGSIMLTGPILFNSCRPNTEEYNIDDLEGIKVDLTSPENVNLKTIGGFVYKDDPISNEQIIIIRASKTLYIALSKLCTHENCVLSFNSFTNELICPCHGSRFKKDGSVVSGPPDIIIDLKSPNYSALKTVGAYVYEDNIIIIRSTETTYIALSKLCTHSQCTITFNSTSGDLPCPCHGSRFTTSGNVISGPAVNPLKKYDVKVTEDSLVISTPMSPLKKYDVKQIGNFLVIS